MQCKRNPLGDMTNSRKPLAKDKSSVKNISSGYKEPEKGPKPPVVRRKPLSDVTNSNKPRAQEKSLKKNCSFVNKGEDLNCGLGEGFLHNHDECIKAQKQSSTMSFDYFMETVGLKKDSTLVSTPPIPWLSKASELEIEEAPMVLDEMAFRPLDIRAPQSPPPSQSPVTPSSPGSPCWITDSVLRRYMAHFITQKEQNN